MTAPRTSRDDVVLDAEDLFAQAALLTGPRLSAIELAVGVTHITEARHLQPVFRAALEEVAADAAGRPEVSPSLGHGLKPEWPRLGTFDISLAWQETTVYGELKCGADALTLSACGWDAAKCAFALMRGVGAGMVLVAAAPAEMWAIGVTGTELWLGGDWRMRDIRERYHAGFTKWEREGYKPATVPAGFSTRPVGAGPVTFAIVGGPWELHVAAVENVSDDSLTWVPFTADDA